MFYSELVLVTAWTRQLLRGQRHRANKQMLCFRREQVLRGSQSDRVETGWFGG